MKRLLLCVSILFICSGTFYAAEQQPEQQSVPQFENIPRSKPYQYQMNGMWLPSVHPLHVGAKNYTTLKNLWPTDTGYETVDGWTKINTTPTETPVNLHHFKKPNETHVVAKINDSGTYYLYDNTTSIPSQGDFSGTALYTVNSGLGSFVNSSQGTMFYADSTYNLIWGGDEMPVSALLTGNNIDSVQDYTDNVSNSLTSKYATVGNGGNDSYTVLLLNCDGTDGSTTFTDSSTSSHTVTANGDAQIDVDHYKFGSASGLFDATGDYLSIPDSSDWDMGTNKITIDGWVYVVSQGETYLYSQYVDSNNFAYLRITTGSGINLIQAAIYSGGSFLLALQNTTPVTISIGEWHHYALIRGWGGGSNDWVITMDGVAVGTTTASITWPNFAAQITIGQLVGASATGTRHIDELRVSKGIARWESTFTPPSRSYSGGSDYFYICSPLKLNGVKLYIAEQNQETSTMTVDVWSGSGWSTLSVTDNTSSGGVSLAQTGTITWPYSEDPEVIYTNGLIMYAYRFALSDGMASIYQAATSPPLQPIRDHWNGSPRVCTAFQVSRTSIYEDYTFSVESLDSTTDTVYGATIGGIGTSDHIIIMSDDRLSGVNIAMVTSKVNALDAQIDAIYYWNGIDWEQVGYFDDNTLDSVGDSSFAQSGVISWYSPTVDEEHPVELFGKIGYAYKIEVDAALTDGTGHDGTSIDYVSGITAQLDLNGYNLVGHYNGRTMLINGSRVDFSQTDTPWVFNGVDSSDDGKASLRFGDNTPIVATTSLFNRYGSNLIEVWVVLKDNSTLILTGSQPSYDVAEPFVIRSVSNTIGCAAPMTLAVHEMEVSSGVRMGVAVWLDYAGPIVYDGTVPTRVNGLEYYFDKNNADSINYTYIDQSVSYIDTVHDQWNLMFPTGSSTTNNIWVVYDFQHKKWFEKSPAGGLYPLAATGVTDADGARYNYGFLSSGYMMRLDNGSSWDGSDIEQEIKTGIFSPEIMEGGGFGFWTRSEMRGIRILSDAISEDRDVTIGLYHDGSLSSQSATVALNSGGEISRNLSGGKNFAQQGNFFQVDFTASTSTNKWSPLAWGYKARFIRED